MTNRRARTLAAGAMAVLVSGCSTGGTTATTVEAEAVPPTVSTTAPVVVEEPVPTPTVRALVLPTPEPSATPPPLPTSTAAEVMPDEPSSTPQTVESATPVPVPTAAPVAGPADVLAANGGEVYTLNCARCHAENGLGTEQYSATLIGAGSRYSNQGMIAELTTGHRVTFGFADRLSADEIASVVAYVKATFP